MTTTTLSKLERILPILMHDNIPVMMWGPSGIGKTESAQQLATNAKVPLIDWRTNLRDPVDARGLPVPKLAENITQWLRPSDLPFKGGKFPKKGVLLLDEINTGSQAMQNVCLQLVLERRVGEHVLEDGWWIMATGNRVKDKGAITRMGQPLKNRFAHFEVEPDVESSISHGIRIGIDQRLLAFLRFKKEHLHCPPVNDDVNAFPTPRQWFQNVNRYLDQPRDIRPHMIQAMVGERPAVDLEGFLRVYHELPTFAEVVKNPEGANVPQEPAARFAVSMMLAREATRNHFGQVWKYAKRLGRELEIHTIIDATRHAPMLTETSTYGEFAIANQDILL